jgi:hypothetical protein
MAKYYYCPLYLPASMRQPGTIINQAAYQPGLTDPVSGETTSAIGALLAAGVDVSVYSTLHGSLTALPCLLPGQIPVVGPQNATPSSNSKPELKAMAEYAPNNFQIGTLASVYGGWPVPGFVGGSDVASFNSGGVPPEFGPFMPPDARQPSGADQPNISRTLWNRTPILYTDINRRMVVETPEAFVDGPFIATGWALKTWQQVNIDYPCTIQGPAALPVTGQNPRT